MTQATFHKTLEGHGSKVNSVAFSPDNKLIASASWDSTVRLWNIPNGDLNAELKGHESQVESVAFSPDGQSIVTGSFDCTVRTWSVATKQQVKTFNGHSDWVYSVAWSPNGKLIASGSWDKTLILWDAISGSATKKLTGHTNKVYSVSFSQNGNKLASAGTDKTAIIWDVDSGAALKLAHSAIVYSVCFSPDDQFIVTGGGDKIVRMFNANTGHGEKRFEGHTDEVISVAISFDGSIIASGSGSSDKSVRLWDVVSTKQLQQLDGHTNTVRSVAFSRDDKFIASGSRDNTVRLWDLPALLQATLDPSQVAKWSVDNVCAYLKQAEIDDDVIAIFRKEKIKGAVLSDYTKHEELNAIGITARGDRTQVINAIRKIVKVAEPPGRPSAPSFITRTDLVFDERTDKLGEGSFGAVYKAKLHDQTVAVKMMTSIKQEDVAGIIKEMSVLAQLPRHVNVAQFIGMSFNSNTLLPLFVLEYCNYGNLHTFLRKQGNAVVMQVRIELAADVAQGLLFLANNNFIHRDVACRNVLLQLEPGRRIVGKVSDFGLSRNIGSAVQYEIHSKQAHRWVAPECFRGIYYPSSDVWSYGVLLWEISTNCYAQPYPDLAEEVVAEAVLNHGRVPASECPFRCPPGLYAIMKRCWAYQPEQRPNFGEIIADLNRIQL